MAYIAPVNVGFRETLIIPVAEPRTEVNRANLHNDEICSDIQEIKNKILTPNFIPRQFPRLTEEKVKMPEKITENTAETPAEKSAEKKGKGRGKKQYNK